MKTKRIYSKNADYQKFEVLKTNRNKRHRYGEFLVEGVRNINEAARCGWAFRSFLYAHGRALSLWAQGLLENVRTDVNCELSPELMEELSGKQDTSELLAVVGMRKENAFAWELSPAPLLALFDRPSNHGNLGAVMRSCDALGVEGLLVTGHAVDPYDPDTVAASMGSFFRLKFAYFPDNQTADGFIAGMREKYPGFITVGTSAHAETRLRDVDLTKPALLFIGNEADGLCAHFRETCDVMAAIPMAAGASASSLNAACAATVFFYEAARQRAEHMFIA
jgi:tRNA G18 (ribose-2'-O)-methylase SpoU